MIQWKNILLVTDRELTVTPAFRRAMDVAKRCGATLHVCSFDYEPAIGAIGYVSADTMQLTANEYMSTRQRSLERYAREAGHKGVRTECAAIWGKAVHDAIIRKALDIKADVVIKDMHAGAPLHRLMHTPLDWQLLRTCPAPVMLVNQDAHPETRRVLAAVDPLEEQAPLNDVIIGAAVDLGMLTGAATHALYAFEYIPPPVGASDPGGGWTLGYLRMVEQTEKFHHDAFDRLMDRHRIPADRRHFLPGGEAEAAIRDFAHDTPGDLLVLGSAYRTGLDRLVLGSTAERILYHVDCDVLVVRPPGFAEEFAAKYAAELAQSVDYSRFAA